MKKLSAIIVALALVFGFTQCKKHIETIAPTSHGGVHITLGIDNDAKHSVNTTAGDDYGKVTFSENDELYVGNGGQFVGTLYYHNGQFEGEIGIDDEPPYDPIELTPDEYLYFYYTGGYKYFDGILEEGDEMYLTFDISDQSDNLPVFSCGKSDVVYNEGVTSYSSMLLNNCALVKFNMGTSTSDQVTVFDMLSEVKFNFNEPDNVVNVFVPTGKRDPIILNSRGTGNTEKWAILLPQTKVDDANVMIGNTLYVDAVDVPAIQANNLVGTNVTINTSNPVLDHEFSVSATQKVYFSRGNLQYNKRSTKWSFILPQYRTIETNNQDVGENYKKQNIVSLFGWGTGNNPAKTDDNKLNYTTYSEWGEHVTIGGITTWRTLTGSEWNYVFKTRTTTSSMRFVKAVVADMPGVILFPDDWNANTYSTLTHVNDNDELDYDVNIISLNDWNAYFESNGAVFMPAAGSREDTKVEDVDDNGYYWASSCENMPDPEDGQADVCRFMYKTVNPFGSYYRNCGYSVRLVYNVVTTK